MNICRECIELNGYEYMEELSGPENVMMLLRDLVDAGMFRDLEPEDLNDMDPLRVAKQLIRLAK